MPVLYTEMLVDVLPNQPTWRRHLIGNLWVAIAELIQEMAVPPVMEEIQFTTDGWDGGDDSLSPHTHYLPTVKDNG